MKSCTSQKRKTHRAGRTGHTGRLPVAENANQVTAFLRSLANLPSLLSLDTQSHCVSPIEMKYVPPYFILDMPSRFECHSNCYFWIVSSCVQNLLGQAPAASSLHALRPARGQCLGLIWRVLKLMTDGHLPQAKLQSEFQFSLSHFPGTAKIRLELKFEHFVHMCVCKGVSQSSPHQVPGQLPGLALYSAWFHRWTPPMSPPDKRDMPFAKWQAVCLWKFLPNRTVGKFVWQLFHEKKHHRSRSTGKPRLYHDSLNTNTGNSHKSTIHNVVCQSSPSPLSNRWNSAAPWLDMKSCWFGSRKLCGRMQAINDTPQEYSCGRTGHARNALCASARAC